MGRGHAPIKARASFLIVGQQGRAAVPFRGAYAVLDTNVVSFLESMALNGFNADNLQHVRGAALLRWIARYEVEHVDGALGALEGSKVARGGASLYQLLRRRQLVEALVWMDEAQREQFLDSGSPIIASVDLHELETRFEGVIGSAEDLIRLHLWPAYIVCLVLRHCREASYAPKETGSEVLGVLMDGIDYVPGFVLAAAMLSTFGGARARSLVSDRVLKLGSPRIQQACLSGAWDLSYLQHQAFLGYGHNDGLLESRGAPVLVTDDQGLASLAATIHATGPAVWFDEELVDPRWAGAYEECRSLVTRTRSRTRPPLETLDLAAMKGIASDYEDRLGIPHAELRADPPRREIPKDVDAIRGLLTSLRLGDEDRYRRIGEIWQRNDVLATSLMLISILLTDNARARDREVKEGLVGFMEQLRARMGWSGLPRHGEKLVAAVAQGGGISASALLEEAEVVDQALYLPSVVYCVEFLEAVIRDTASALGTNAIEHLDWLDTRLARLANDDESEAD